MLLEDKVPEINPLDVISECIDRCKGTNDREQIAHYIAEALGFLQIDDSEDDASACSVTLSSRPQARTRSTVRFC